MFVTLLIVGPRSARAGVAGLTDGGGDEGDLRIGVHRQKIVAAQVLIAVHGWSPGASAPPAAAAQVAAKGFAKTITSLALSGNAGMLIMVAGRCGRILTWTEPRWASVQRSVSGQVWRLSGRWQDAGDILRGRSGSAYIAFTVLTKEIPALYLRQPWRNDPYDALVSFDFVALPLLVHIGALRVLLFRLYEALPARRVVDLLRVCASSWWLSGC